MKILFHQYVQETFDISLEDDVRTSHVYLEIFEAKLVVYETIGMYYGYKRERFKGFKPIKCFICNGQIHCFPASANIDYFRLTQAFPFLSRYSKDKNLDREVLYRDCTLEIDDFSLNTRYAYGKYKNSIDITIYLIDDIYYGGLHSHRYVHRYGDNGFFEQLIKEHSHIEIQSVKDKEFEAELLAAPVSSIEGFDKELISKNVVNGRNLYYDQHGYNQPYIRHVKILEPIPKLVCGQC